MQISSQSSVQFSSVAQSCQGVCGCVWAPRSPDGDLNFNSSPLVGLPHSCLPLPAKPGRHPQPARMMGQRDQAEASAGVGVRMEYYSSINKNGTSSHSDGRGAHCAPSEISQTEKDKSCVIKITYTWNLKNTTN